MIRLAIVAALALGACKPKPPTSPHCVSNTELQFKRIDDRYAKFQAGEKPPGNVYWARHDLEVARFVLTGKGIDGSGAGCTGPDHDSKDYDRLMMGLTARTTQVEEMETVRGVRFDRTENNGLYWVDRNTSQPIPGNDANTL